MDLEKQIAELKEKFYTQVLWFMNENIKVVDDYLKQNGRMCSKELRIGNFIQLFRTPTDFEMTAHAIAAIDSDNVQLADGFLVNHKTGIRPIPLSEEWLTKFGFYRSGDVYSYGNGTIGIFFNRSTKEGGYDISRFKYVHQLQNLYFALTNTELKCQQQ